MVLKKSFRVLRRHKPRSVVLESKAIEDESLLFESNTIATLSKPTQLVFCCLMPQPYLRLVLTAPAEVEIIRRDYGEPAAAYGCLGVLQVAQGREVFHYLVLITDCQSVGKVESLLP